MANRTSIIAGNWKMHKTSSETRSFLEALKSAIADFEPNCEIVVAPPFTSIATAVAETDGTRIRVAAQNLHWEDRGAFTGEVSGPMVKEIGCSHVIIGHSERRQYFGETDESVNRKIQAAMRSGLVPIFCLGETLEEREAGKTFDVVKRQLIEGIGKIESPDPDRFVIAYEPVWAIGTGKTATPQQAQEVHEFLRTESAKILGQDFSDRTRILYGGSVKPDNTRSLLNQPDIDGGLVGGASLTVQDFLGIIKEAI
ncbi:triose-phosphate isomerase [Desulfomonile tiedjei]|uniref:Triosephosphate isomerase n=1 Tax=Desulfomonile tiedjei (strain ATCC 49306 / DSM 6799 / DCB-1) TaxID=706587 RepID=I4BZR4_DESTA|nr:triose-phosphate isomerase [Desulfomonile tiedjei]AFM22805.1 triosephosphate isomerase [Desulfomonile tiedjei DSM 6799]